MPTQQNTVYLSYSQDATRRLPLVVVQGLRANGYNVFMETNHFKRFNSPPEAILEQIKSQTHFVLLLTPASIRYGFNFCEKRLKEEIEQAKQTNRVMIVIFAYNLDAKRTRNRWSLQSVFPENLIEVVMQGTNVEPLVGELNALLRTTNEPFKPMNPSPTQVELEAEYLLDQGLTEQYDSETDNRRGDAVSFYNQALAVDPNYAEAYFQRAETFHWAFYRQEVKAETLLADYDQAVRLNPIESRYYSGRAHIYERMSNRVLAIEDYTKAIEYAPQEAAYYSSRGDLYSSSDNLDAALHDYNKAVELNPTIAHHYLRRGVIFSQKGEKQHAINDLTKTIEIDQRDRDYIFRGFLYADIKDFTKAEADWQHAVEISKHPADAYSIKAHMHRHRGELQESLQSVNLALQLAPDSNFALGIRDDVLKRIEAQNNK